MKRLCFGIALVFCLCAAAGAESDYPGPTGRTGFGTFDVVGFEPAVRSMMPRALPPAASNEDEPAVVFPQTYIRDDQNLTWKIDGDTGQVELVSNELPSGLTDTMKEAILKAPTWLQTPLVDRFLGLDPADAEAFADLIVNPEDERYVDEYAFLIAMTADRDLNRDHALGIIEQTVRNIYEFDEFLDYVEVVDTGEPGKGDYFTTTRYVALVDGEEETFELPKEVYYKYIVHSKCDHEELAFKKPSTGSTEDPEEGGVFYREYFMYDAEGEDSYVTPYFMRTPNVITEEELQSWGDGETASTYFSAREIYNIDAVYHENGEPVLVEIAYGAGTALYTTLNVEEAYDTEESLLLENLLAYGCGDITLDSDKKIVILDGQSKIPTQVFVQNVLTGLGYTDVSIVDLTTFLAYTGEELSDIDKIIVVGNESHDAYEAVATNPAKGHPDLGAWLSGGYKVLEVHMSTSEDISDLTFYGGYQVPAPGANGTGAVTLGGRPLLFDVIAQADHVWDEEVYDGLSGDRSFESDGAMALRIIGNWAGKNMMDNVSEYGGKNGIPPSGNIERAVEPVRIVRNHFGNCGECQDVWTAALRTCLIPAMNVSDYNEDHVWNEFYHDGQWRYLQNDWSNAATRIASPGGGQDADDKFEGGGKTTSFIFGWDGNGEIFSVIDNYSYSITLEFNLTDGAGQPVPGAKIWIGSEGYYSGSNTWSFIIFTDENGHAEVKLGDSRNYYVRVESGAGYWPDTSDHHAVQVVVDTDATADSVHTVDHQMDEILQGEAILDETDAESPTGMHLAFDLKQRFQHLYNDFVQGEMTRFPENKGVDVYLVGEGDVENARAGKDSYTVYKAWEGVTDFDENIFPPASKGGDYYVVVSGKTNPESMMTLDIATAESVENSDDDDDDDDETDDDDDNEVGGDDDDDDGGCCG